MKRFVSVVLVALMGLGFMGSFVGCKEGKSPPPVQQSTPKGENAPAPAEK
jgi:hypothetical protein